MQQVSSKLQREMKRPKCKITLVGTWVIRNAILELSVVDAPWSASSTKSRSGGSLTPQFFYFKFTYQFHHCARIRWQTQHDIVIQMANIKKKIKGKFCWSLSFTASSSWLPGIAHASLLSSELLRRMKKLHHLRCYDKDKCFGTLHDFPLPKCTFFCKARASVHCVVKIPASFTALCMTGCFVERVFRQQFHTI